MSATETAAASTAAQALGDDFDLDVRLVEFADPAGLVNLTDDGCGSTCGACVTGAA
jgi:FxLD family lantipeptide